MKSYAIADLHCDLLSHLSRDKKNNAYDLAVRCAIPQLKEGNVKLQTMAISSLTAPNSSKIGVYQAEIFLQLPALYPEIFTFFKVDEQIQEMSFPGIKIIASIENASSICSEEDDLNEALGRLTLLLKKLGKIAYMGMTWNTENRFGGGASTKLGLKEDGKVLIDFLAQHHIPIDFSHTSDYLAFDILNYLEKKSLRLPVIASHSNLRAIVDVPRNLSDELALEIIRRKGIIGLNFIRHFVNSNSPNGFISQLEHLLQLGGQHAACFGADFYHDDDLPLEYRVEGRISFYPDFSHAGTYPRVIDLWKKQLHLSEEILLAICHRNYCQFLKGL